MESICAESKIEGYKIVKSYDADASTKKDIHILEGLIIIN